MLILLALGLADDTALNPSQVAGTKARIATECDLPQETAVRVVVSGELRGDAYQGLESLSLVLTNPTDWQITEITVELSTSASDPPFTIEYVLRATNAVKPGETATLTATLEEVVPDRRARKWRYLRARGLPPRP